MLAVELNPGLAGARRACLRPLCGQDEAVIQSGELGETLALIEHLLVPRGEDSLPPERVRELPVCDVDWLAATLYLRDFGDHIESRTCCVGCGKSFDVSFSLRELMQASDETRTRGIDGVTGPDETGAFALDDGRRFRLPTTRDLELAGALDSEDAVRRLREACVLDGDPDFDPETLDEAMAAVGPVLDTDLETACPDCGTPQRVRFEVQSFLGRALAFERRFLNHEVHQLARAYGWQRSDILAMTREDRRAHVRLILAEVASARRRTSAMWS